VPADESRSLEDEDAGFPAMPDRGEPTPQKAVTGGQLWTFDRTLEDADLMAQGQNLQLKGRTAPK
jgi:hypothetical protein